MFSTHGYGWNIPFSNFLLKYFICEILEKMLNTNKNQWMVLTFRIGDKTPRLEQVRKISVS